MADGGYVVGAAIEQGVIVEEADGGYVVASYTRKGVVTLPLDAMPGTAGGFAEGDKVYFFAFRDGHGMILGKIDGTK